MFLMDEIEEIKSQHFNSIRKAGDEFKNFPHRLRQLRLQEVKNKLEAPLKQNELARLVDLLPPNYSRIEKGGIAPSVGLLISLSEYFGVSIDYLVKGNPAALNNRFEPVKLGRNEPPLFDELLKSKEEQINVLNILVRQLQEENKRLVSMVNG